ISFKELASRVEYYAYEFPVLLINGFAANAFLQRGRARTASTYRRSERSRAIVPIALLDRKGLAVLDLMTAAYEGGREESNPGTKNSTGNEPVLTSTLFSISIRKRVTRLFTEGITYAFPSTVNPLGNQLADRGTCTHCSSSPSINRIEPYPISRGPSFVAVD
ncbi:precursor of peptide 1, partial [Striga asiatica]